jgi:hypothetical protein
MVADPIGRHVVYRQQERSQMRHRGVLTWGDDIKMDVRTRLAEDRAQWRTGVYMLTAH